MRNFSIQIAIILIMIFMTGCSKPIQIVSDQYVSGLEIPEMTSSLGSLDGLPDKQFFSYAITLVNTNIYKVEIQWIEPILSDELVSRVSTQDRKTEVHQSVQPGGVLEISGQFSFNAEGMSKEQILEWEPFMTSMRVASEASLPLPAVNIQ